MLNYLKKIFSIFLIFNLTFVSSAQAAAAATFDNINGDGTGFDITSQTPAPVGIAFNNDGTKMFVSGENNDQIYQYTLSAGFLYKNETEFAFDLSEDMTSNFKISKALGVFDLEFNLENDFSKQENHNANLTLSNKF